MAAQRERARTTHKKGGVKPRRKARHELRQLVGRNTKAVERVHRAVTALPLDVLGRIGRFEKPVARMRELIRSSNAQATWVLMARSSHVVSAPLQARE